ncbi:MAG: HAD-IB family hydrolase [Acidimicrobiales bacterium]|jgi:putative phosphoserine phosphatase/1-acylglycerol-3-phosphate O-acyltransferase
MGKSAVFIDLDRTLLCQASGQVFNKALMDEGVLPQGRTLPGDWLLYAVNNRLGENLLSMGLVRAAARVAKGWRQDQVQAAGKRAVPELIELVAPFAPQYLAAFREAGHRLVLTTTTPVDMITPFAEAMGFDALIATSYETKDGRYTGRLYEGFVWGTGKLKAVRAWAEGEGIDLDDCHACSDSVFDTPLLASVGSPHAVNPDPSLTLIATARRWPIEYWDRPPGVPSVVGFEPYHLLRPFVRPSSFPYARFDLTGLDHIPAKGPVLLAANHRSYFDVAALALVAARLGRPVRFLGKKEIFDAPVVGTIARAIGGIPVDRGSGSDRPLRAAEAALRAGEVVIVLPQGTIPRGEAFFNPILKGKTGTARLAAATGAVVVPIGLWGTEKVWARSARTPDFTLVLHPPRVTIRVGHPLVLSGVDARADTAAIMAAISTLLPEESWVRHEPTAEELARTKPPS